MSRTYATRNDAIDNEIVAAIESGISEDARSEYDVDAIADEVLGGIDTGFRVNLSEEEFWGAVERHAR